MTMLFPREVAPVRELRDYQVEAIHALRTSLRSGKRRPILQAATGSGKTRLAGEIFSLAREKGNRVVFCVPRIDLIDQTLESFWSDGIGDIGVIQADHVETDWSRPVQIASVQTLQRRGYPDAQLVITDECHMGFKFIHEWMALPAWQNVPFIGLSATPWTKGLGKHYDDLIIATTTKDMIDKGYLSKFKVFAPSHPDLKGVRVQRGDYVESDLSEAMNKAPLVANIVETWLRQGEGRPTLCFGVDRAHAKALQQQFLAAGVSCGYQDSYTEKDERAEIKRKFHAREYAVVCNIATLTTGVDWDVRCIILARPTRSDILLCQIVGRGLRTAPGKDHLVLLDHSDSTLKLGLVTDIHHDELDDGNNDKKKKKDEPLPKECPKCTYLMPPKTLKCPSCGHEKQLPPGIKNVEGELVEFGTGGKVHEKIKNGCIEMRGKQIPLAEFFGELKCYAESHGYKPGWAAQKYKTATGVWPNAHKGVEAIPPRYEVLSWIKSQTIRFLKAREKADAR